jgi:hypothetical protein
LPKSLASERLDFSAAAKVRDAAQEEWQRLNREIAEVQLILLFWEIGQDILKRQDPEIWRRPC